MKSKLRPLALGDTVRIVTPASPLTEEKLRHGIQWLEFEGFKVELAEHALCADGYLAGTDQERASDFQAAFEDDSVAAVICARGGYGCVRLLPFLDLDLIAASRKMLLGFSDVTVFHSALNRRGMPTVHAPMPITLHWPRAQWVYESLRRILKDDLTVPEQAPKPTTVVGGIAEGESAGGCMCLLTDSIGTPNEFETQGKIVFIEDVDEQPHRVDAMFTHFVHSGLAAKASGFVIGEMTRTDERADMMIGEKPWRNIVIDCLAPLGKPMVIDYPFGHAPNMLTVPMGIRTRLDADTGTVTYLESLCS